MSCSQSLILIERSEKRMSHPVGTTITLTDFLKGIPVRRQTAAKEKTAVAVLAKIKRLIQSYALARPHVRFSLKVSKAKNDKGNFTYAPKPAASSRVALEAITVDAPIKLFGKKLADQCEWVRSSWSDRGDLIEPVGAETAIPQPGEDPCYTIETSLPHPGCSDFSMVSVPRQFAFVDSRPVKCARGTLKQVISIFKNYYRAAGGHDQKEKPVDPFIFVNIICPPGSYDVNIEPAKDDVLFTDPKLLIQIAEEHFRDFYGEPQAESTRSPGAEAAPKSRTFDMLLAKKPIPVSDLIVSRSILDGDDILRDIGVSNPWAIAKLTAALRPVASSKQGAVEVDENSKLLTPSRQPGDRSVSPKVSPVCQSINFDAPGLPTPGRNQPGSPSEFSRTSPDPFPYPQRAWGTRQDRDANTHKASIDRERYGNGALDTWVQRSFSDYEDTSQQSCNKDHVQELANEDPLEYQQPFVSARTLPTGTRLSDIPDISQKPRRKQTQQKQHQETLRKPFVSPVHDLERVWFETGEHRQAPRQTKTPQPQQRLTLQHPTPPSLDLRSSETDFQDPPELLTHDLAQTMDYEFRKQAATKHHHETLQQAAREQNALQRAVEKHLCPKSSQPPNSPHKNRYHKAIAALHNSPNPDAGIADLSAFAPGDPRGNLIRTQTSHPNTSSPVSGKRIKAPSLPLESVRNEDSARELVLEVSASCADIEASFAGLGRWDEYVTTGEIGAAFAEVDARLVGVWEGEVRGLLRRRMGIEGGGLVMDLAGALRGGGLMG